ncbi:MAG: asparagine synthase C-terminal domain-containing protein [Clostridia bacterium]|nr:asparagine synthase C-terminal domain-containing protein [Clostridia bacterium]
MIVLNPDILYKKEYWKLESKFHTDDLETTCEKIRDLLFDAVSLQVRSAGQVSSSLSGGLDSSIVTAIANDIYQEKGQKLKTFSVDYVDQEKNFVKNDFQPNLDMEYIQLMVKKLGTEHHKILLDTPELYENLKEAMVARDFPGMADVDSSYLLFFDKIAKTGNNIVLAGECSDEIFGGYPWYFREDGLSSNTFPWSLALEERQKILNEDIGKQINLKDYVQNEYEKSLAKVELLDTDSNETKLHRKLTYLTLNWFMITLLDRTDRMAKLSNVEVRVPFCDYRVMEYAWNIPWEMKAYKGREKGLLRKAFEGYLPEEIIYRKKSPYPKTHNPNYLAKVKEGLTQIMENKNNKISNLLNEKYIKEILETDGKAFARPWFGQLMTGPQLMAYLIQVELWLEIYNPEIII